MAIFPVLYITSLYLIYLIPRSLYLLILYPYLAPHPFSHPFPLPTGNHYFVLSICESVSILLYTFVCFI